MQIVIGTMIKNYRKQHGISQEDFAESLGVCKQAVSKWEMERNLPDTYTLPKIAALIGCKVDDFFKDTEE